MLNRHSVCGSWLRFWEIRVVGDRWARFDFCDKCEVFTIADEKGTVYNTVPKDAKGRPAAASTDFTQRS